jgi:energy-coupling factor transport system ATP-binding protein
LQIIFDKVNYIYSTGTAFARHAIKDISFTINKGEFIGLIGHTGSGKSTLIQHMNGLIKATNGHIYFNGQDIYDPEYKLMQLRSKVGLVFQYPEHQLFETTVFKDVIFGPMNLGLDKLECELRSYEALKMVGIGEDLLDASPFELSGGQKRRVAIAGVLAMKPEVLILDEPTAGLDPKGRDDILAQIEKLHKESGLTIILVTHSMEDVAYYADRLFVMNHGELVLQKTTKEVFSHYKELEEMQLAAPQVTYVMNALKSNGYPVKTDATTVAEAKDEIMRVIKSQALAAEWSK